MQAFINKVRHTEQGFFRACLTVYEHGPGNKEVDPVEDRDEIWNEKDELSVFCHIFIFQKKTLEELKMYSIGKIEEDDHSSKEASN